jgi:hypothetical protein
MPRHELMLVGTVELDHISNNYDKFMKECADTDYDRTSRPPPTSSMENPSPFYTHLWRWAGHYRDKWCVGRLRVVMLG